MGHWTPTDRHVLGLVEGETQTFLLEHSCSQQGAPQGISTQDLGGGDADSQAPKLPHLDSVPPGEGGEPLVQRRVSKEW